MDQGEIVAGGLVVAGGDRPKSLQAVEEDFDEVALPVESSDESVLDLALWLGVDDGLHAARTHSADELVGVVASVANERLASGVTKQLLGDAHLVALPRRERDVDGAAFGVDDGVELR